MGELMPFLGVGFQGATAIALALIWNELRHMRRATDDHEKRIRVLEVG